MLNAHVDFSWKIVGSSFDAESSGEDDIHHVGHDNSPVCIFSFFNHIVMALDPVEAPFAEEQHQKFKDNDVSSNDEQFNVVLRPQV